MRPTELPFINGGGKVNRVADWRIDCSVRFLGSQESIRDRFLAILSRHEPTWGAEPIEGYTSNGINVRPEWVASWSVPIDNPKQYEAVATSVGQRMRVLVSDDRDLLASVGRAGIFYLLSSAKDPARRT